MGGLADSNRPKWLEYVKEGRKNKVQIQDMADHIGVAKNTLKAWIKKWKEEKAIEGKLDWEQYKEYVVKNSSIMTQEEMANNLGVAYHSLHKRVRRWGVEARPYAAMNKWKDYVVANRNDMTIKQISDHIGVVESCINRWIKEWKEAGEIQKKVTKRGIGKRKKERVPRTPREKKPKVIAPKVIKKAVQKVSPTKPQVLPTRVVDESQYRYINVDSRTRIQIPVEVNEQEAIDKWNKKYKKAI